MKHYPVRERWTHRIKPHLANPDLQRILVRDMSLFRHTFRPGMIPAQADGCDWRWHGNPRRGRSPAFWDWVCHSACH